MTRIFQNCCVFSIFLDGDLHPVQTVAHLMKLSFDEGHRQAICLLGGIHTIASLVEVSILSFLILLSHYIFAFNHVKIADWFCTYR